MAVFFISNLVTIQAKGHMSDNAKLLCKQACVVFLALSNAWLDRYKF